MFTKLIEGAKLYLRARETERALAGLTDAALDDIGLTRAGIANLSTRAAPARAKATLVFDPFALNLAFPLRVQAA